MQDHSTKEFQALSNEDELNVRRAYQEQTMMLDGLAVSVRLTVEAVLKKADIPYHSVKYRVKSLSSLLEKVVRKQYKIDLSNCTDLVGVRVICLSPSHLDPITAILKTEFNVLEVVDKRPRADSQQFGYSSIHLVCKLKGTARGELTEYAALAEIPFEVQVRTILQEAWSEMDHRLVYKTQAAAPPEIQRLITRLSIALESADEMFQQIFERRQNYVDELRMKNSARLNDEPLNIDLLNEVIRRAYPWAEGWAEERDQQYMSQNMNSLLMELASVGIKSAGQLGEVLHKWNDVVIKESRDAFKAAIKAQESEDGPHPFARVQSPWQFKTESFYVPLGLVRRSLKHEFPSYNPPGAKQPVDAE